MYNWQKEVQESLLDSEQEALDELEKQYKKALIDINGKVKGFQSDIDLIDQALQQQNLDENTKAMLLSQKQSKIYQKQYQEALQGQISGIVDKMQADHFGTLDSYLKQSYEDGYLATMYDLASQGIPIIAPIDQAQAVKAILTDSKISEGYYNKLGVDYNKLKKSITQEVSRGIASGLSYADIARNINNVAQSGLNNAKRIARTEGHRIQQEATANAQQVAKSKGADVVKQWDATLDGRTRESHRIVDGEIKELDEPYSNGMMFPGDPAGGAAEVCNCRCVSLTRARWALDEEELKTLQDRAEYFGLDKTDSFKDYKSKYLQASEEESKNEFESTVINPIIKTSKYRRLYNNVDESMEIQRIEYNEARKMLEHRSGTKYEDQTFIDSKTGKFLTRKDYDQKQEVIPTKKMIQMAKGAEPYTMIAMHNHPGSSVPSISDLESAYKHSYKYGLIVCHNGYLMKYKVTGDFNPAIVDGLLDRANRYIYTTETDTSEKLKVTLEYLKQQNVLLEVFKP